MRLAAGLVAVIAASSLILTLVAGTFTVLADNGEWSDADIGSSGEQGSVTFASPVRMTITGTGPGIGGTEGGTSDGFYFVYQPVSKPLLMQARLDSLTAAAIHNANAGIMFRSKLEESSTFAYTSVVATTPIGVPGVGIQWRRRDGIDANGTLPFPIRPEGLPIWLRSIFQNGLVTGFVSFNPEAEGWIELDSTSVEVGESGRIFVGFAVTSGDENNRITATFSEITYRNLPECLRDLEVSHVEERIELTWTNAGNYDEITILKNSPGATYRVLAAIRGDLKSYSDLTQSESSEVNYELIPSVAGHALCVARAATGELATSIRLLQTTRGTVIGPRPFPEELPVNPEAGGDIEKWAAVLENSMVANREVAPGEVIKLDLELGGPSIVAVSAEFSRAEASNLSVDLFQDDNLIVRIQPLTLTDSRVLFKDAVEVTQQMYAVGPDWSIRLSNTGSTGVNVFAFAGIRASPSE